MIIFIFFQIVNSSICDVLEQECWVQCGKPLIFPFRERCTDSPYSIGIADCWTPPNCTCVIPAELQDTYYNLKICQIDTCGNYNWATLIRGSTKWCRACGYDCNGNQQNCIDTSGYCKSPAVCGALQMCNRWRTDACNKGLFDGSTCEMSTTNVVSTLGTTNVVSTLGTTNTPTNTPTNIPTQFPTNTPTNTPTNIPTQFPTNTPTQIPSTPTYFPTNTPTQIPSTPTNVPSYFPTNIPTNIPSTTTNVPTNTPTQIPTNVPTKPPYVYTPYPTSYQLFTLTPTPSPSEIIVNTEKGMTTTELVLTLCFVTWVIISSGIIFYCWVIKLPVIPFSSGSSNPLVESPPSGISSYSTYTTRSINTPEYDSEDEFAEILSGMSSDYSKRKIKSKLRKGKK